MSSSYLVADNVVLPGGVLEKGPYYVYISNGKISKIGKDEPVDISAGKSNYKRAHLITPGFIDIHTHGYGGADDVVDFWLNPDFTLARMPSKGTTSCLASIVFPKNFKTQEFSEVFREHVGKVSSEGRAVLEGVHAEGPIVNDCGGLPEGNIDMTLVEFNQLIDSLPSVKIMTISPHLEAVNKYARMKALLSRGITPALGHDRIASESEILGALRQSHTPLHITHLFNVCSFNHRSPSLVNFGLSDSFPNTEAYKGLTNPPTVEVIGDMAHVHPLSLSILIKARGYQNICFITDSVFQSTVPGETVSYNGRNLTVSPDCKTMVLEGTSTIAGSCCTMLEVFHNLVHTLRIPVGQAVAMLSENPARVAKLDHIGMISEGKRADILLFDESFQLMTVYINGAIAWNRNEI